MPRRNENAVTPTSNALALPADVREDLLRAQADQIENVQRLPRVKIMPQGVGLFEFGDNNETEREFEGVILNSHPRNILWDSAFGTERAEGEEGPACVANDGRYGTPRPGFTHLGLPGNMEAHQSGDTLVAARGTERIECATCPYNQWGSKALLDPTLAPERAKGKAVVNQRAIYVMLADRELPVELILPPTSLTKYDEYLASLLNRGVPVQAIVTRFRQERQERGTLRWSVVVFERGEDLSQEVFDMVMQKRQRYAQSINPQQVDYSNAEVGGEPLPF